MRSNLLLSIFSLLFGLAFGVLFHFPIPEIIVVIFLSFIVLFLYKEDKLILSAALVVIFFSVGLLRTEYIKEPSLEYEKNVTLEGVIKTEIENTKSGQNFIVDVTEYNVLVRTNSLKVYKYGDLIEFQGLIKEPLPFVSNGRTFYYDNYLKTKGVAAIVSNPKISILERDKGSFIKENLFKFKEIFLIQSKNIFSFQESSLFNGILFGVKSSLGEDLENILRQVALIHIVVLSGYNVSIIAEALVTSISYISRKWAFLIAMIAIIAFVLMVGAGPSVVRAGVMASLLLLARMLRSGSDIIIYILLAALLMSIWNPYVLLYDPGFHLSFIATVGIILLVPLFDRLTSHNWFGVKEVFLTTLSAQVSILPYTLLTFGSVSLIGSFANLFVVPIVPFVMFFGMLAILLSFLSQTLAFPIIVFVKLLLNYFINTAIFFSQIPFSHTQIGASYWWSVLSVLFYSFGGYFVFKFKPFR